MELGAGHLQSRVVRTATLANGTVYPIYAVMLGNPDPGVPAVGYFGGVHGLERIGSEVVIAYLQSLVMRLQWDSTLHRQLESVRMVFMPIVNPGGMWLGTRANPRGVDLMRNAPVDALEPVPFLVGGQRLSARLPWYRGAVSSAMEVENEEWPRSCPQKCCTGNSAWRWIATPALAPVIASGFRMRIPGRRLATLPRCMHSKAFLPSHTATTATPLSPRASSTWRMGTCGTICTAKRAKAIRAYSCP